MAFDPNKTFEVIDSEAPAFDPSKPFDVAEAPAFDPNKPFEPAPDDPTMGEIGTGLVADIAVAEGTKYAGAAGGAALGSAVPVVGTAVGGALGYAAGAVAGGISGSLLAQEVEGRDEVSWGRVVGDTLLNFIPGSKLAKGGKFGVRAVKAGAKQGLAGAAIAPTAQSIESIIEEGKIPEKEELFKMAGTGAALGFGLGGASVGLEKVFGKVGGKTMREVDDMVATGDLTFKDFKVMDEAFTPKGSKVKGADAPVMEGLMRREVEEVANRRASKLMAEEIIKAEGIADKGLGTFGKIKASLIPSKVMGRKSQQAAIDFKRNALAAEELGSKIARNIERKIGKSPELNDVVNKMIDGQAVDVSPDQIKRLGNVVSDIEKYQSRKLELQKQMVSLLDEGAYSGLDESGRRALRKSIQDSIDGKAYNRREYKFFLDKNYQPTKEQERAAFNELAATMGSAKAKKHMDKLQNASAATKSEDPRSFFGSAVDSVLKRRHKPGAAERAWLGEITQAPERIRGTLSGMGRSAARAEADSRIAKSLLEDGLGSTQKAEGMVELVLRGTGPEGTGVYVNPEVQIAMNNIYLPSSGKGMENIVLGGMLDLYSASVAGSKASKVLLNTIAYPVQLYGNTATLIGMGINPLRGAKRGFDLALSEFGGIERLKRSSDARLKLLNEVDEMNKYGLKGANILESDLRNTLDQGIFSKMVGKVTDPLGKAYSVPDTMGRYVGWKASQRSLRKIFPEASEELIKREAASMINDTYQNYDKLSNVVRTLSRWGVMPQFASFTAEFARNQYNQGIMIAKMSSGKFGQSIREAIAKEKIEAARLNRAQTGNVLKPQEIERLERKIIQDVDSKVNLKSMRVEAAKRLAGLTAVYGGTYGVIEGLKRSTGITQEDEDAARNLGFAPWDKNREMVLNLDKKTRKGWVANPSYIVPHAIGLSALKAGMRGDDEATVAGFVADEIVGEGSFIMQEAYRALRNKDKNQKTISNEMGALKNAAERIKYFAIESFRPGVSREIKKAAEAKRGAGDLTLAEVGQRQLGLRKSSIDLNEGAQFAVRDSYRPAQEQSSSYYSLIKYNEPSEQQAREAYQKAERINQQSFAALVENKKSMLQFDFTEDEIVNTMKEAGVPSKKILSVLNETYEPLPLYKLPSTSEVYEELEGSRSQKRSEILKIRRADRELGDRLLNRWKREGRKSNLSAKDELLKNLDVRERVAYLKANPGKLQELRRKGIATDAVVRAYRMSQN